MGKATVQDSGPIKYVAFLRGINVGGHKTLRTDELKEAFESLGFKNVRTVLASGNVLFEAPISTASFLAQKIEEKLKQTSGREIGVLIRTIEEIRLLAETNPFKGIKATPQTRFYVTFLSEKPKSDLGIPPESSGEGFTLLRVSDSEVCSVLTLSPGNGTTDLMDALEKEFGRKITTRNWNTITRILKNYE